MSGDSESLRRLRRAFTAAPTAEAVDLLCDELAEAEAAIQRVLALADEYDGVYGQRVGIRIRNAVTPEATP